MNNYYDSKALATIAAALAIPVLEKRLASDWSADAKQISEALGRYYETLEHPA